MKQNTSYIVLLVGIVVIVALIFLGSQGKAKDQGEGKVADAEKSLITVDGSSTVYPITEAVAEDFAKTYPANVTVGVSGTGGGFKKFCMGEIDISDASRPIKQTEIDECAKHNVEFVELPVAFDGLAVVVNPANTWVDSLSVAELKKIWEPEAQAKVLKWSDVRPSWPDKELHLFGPGVDSGTFDYFTEAIVGKEGSSRGDFTASEDDNVLVQGVASDEGGLGFFGVAYYESNMDALKVVPISKDGNTPNALIPTYDNVLTGKYQPLSRPLFIYVAKLAATRPEVSQFVSYYLAQAEQLVRSVGYIALPTEAYPKAQAKFDRKQVGTSFTQHGAQVGVTIDDILKAE